MIIYNQFTKLVEQFSCNPIFNFGYIMLIKSETSLPFILPSPVEKNPKRPVL